MSFFSKLLGGGVVDAAKGITEVIGNYKSKKLDSKVAMAELEQRIPNLQAAINAVEANHPSLFVSGWRPFVGWICGFGLAYSFLVRPIVNGLVAVAMTLADAKPLELFPGIAVGELISLLVAMLGLAGYRSYEKKHKAARD